ncbi:uncharacterized protein RCO7_09112 [Rhynchosporium graminicola]|uniref:RING-type domain-containing protein n=1 Tax=Rhynchosporium graminicola TaxID=2792576 RepID=A0A1E1LTF2_9HELO|nr:uncharacterized protein RCO7_09112 [Rhynchosporium commune]
MCHNIQIHYYACEHSGVSKIIPCDTPSTCGDPILEVHNTPHAFPDFRPDCFLGGNLFVTEVSEDERAEILTSRVYKEFTSKSVLCLAESMLRRAESNLAKEDELYSFENQVTPEEVSASIHRLQNYALNLLGALFWHQVIEEKEAPDKFFRLLIIQVKNYMFALWHQVTVNKLTVRKKARTGRPSYLEAKVLFPSITSLEADERDCAICGDQIGIANADGVTEYLVKTSCGHVFGVQCLSQWILDNESCPYCRGSLLTFDESEVNLKKEANNVRRNTLPPAWLMTLFGITSRSMKRDMVLSRSRGAETLALSKECFP